MCLPYFEFSDPLPETFFLFGLIVNNILLTLIQLQVYNYMVNREKINRIWKLA